MSFKAEEERNVLQSCCLMRALSFGLLSNSVSPCSLTGERSRGHGGKRLGSLNTSPVWQLTEQKVRAPHESRGSTGRREAGATIEVDVSSMVSRKSNPNSPSALPLLG